MMTDMTPTPETPDNGFELIPAGSPLAAMIERAEKAESQLAASEQAHQRAEEALLNLDALMDKNMRLNYPSMAFIIEAALAPDAPKESAS